MALSGLAAIVARGTTVLTSLISVPLTLKYLGQERYGLWMTISSTTALLSFADLGLGNGIVTGIADAHGRNDIQAAKRLVSNGFFMLTGVGASIIAVFFIAYPWVSWGHVYNISTPDAIKEAGLATAALMVSLAVTLPLSIAPKVHLGFQEGFSSNLWAALGAILGLGGVFAAINFKAALPILVLGMSGGPLVALLLNWLVLFYVLHPELRPDPARFEFAASKQLCGTGIMFLTLQLCAMLGNTTDSLVLAHTAGVGAVGAYAVTQRIFTVTQLAQYFIPSLWSAFSEAVARSDFAWARSTLRRALLISVAISLVTVVPLSIFGRNLVSMWAGPEVAPSRAMLLGFAAWAVLAGYGGILSAVLNRGDVLRRQTRAYVLASAAAFVLKMTLGPLWGGAGVIWATVVGYTCIYVWPATKLAFSEANGPVSAGRVYL